MSTITIPVNDRTDMSFDGVKIASVSTRRPEGSRRWTELALYDRTDEVGGYVFQRVGRSNVYHAVDCPKVFGRLDMEPVPFTEVDPGEDFPCEVCHPEDTVTSEGTVVYERDKYSVVSVGSARKLIIAVQDRDRATGELRVSKLAQELLQVAAASDDDIRQASLEALLSGE